MSRLADLSVGKRLGLLSLVLSLLIVAASAAGQWGLSRQHDIAVRTQQLEAVEDEVQKFAYHIADLTGWQGLVIADSGAYGGRAATKDDAYNRKGELASKKDLFASIDALEASSAHLTGTENALVAKLQPAWENFFVLDGQIMELMRRDTQAARVEAMDSINGGPAGAAWAQGVDISTELTASIGARSTALAAEALRVEENTQRVLLGTALLALLLAAGLSVLVTRSVVRPLAHVVGALGRVARGDLTVRVGLRRKDEIGRLGAAVDDTVDALRGTVAELVAHSDALDGSSQRLSDVAESIAFSSQEASSQAGVVAAAAGDVSHNVDIVAAGGEEMGASIREISHNTTEAATVASEAVAMAEATNAVVAQLGASSVEIGNVVKVITGIAGQTNLLSLNATIEAARAGEAGKGFAVVAGEVKDLAQETARATGDIAQRVTSIQASATAAAEAIAQIGEITARINDYQSTIAAAVEEQTAVTAEMSRNIADAAASSGEIAANIAGVARAAASTDEGVAQSRRAAGELAGMSRSLRELVGRFTV